MSATITYWMFWCRPSAEYETRKILHKNELESRYTETFNQSHVSTATSRTTGLAVEVKLALEGTPLTEVLVVLELMLEN